MAVVVAGKLMLKPQSRDKFIDGSRDAIFQARQNAACEDFSVSPDPIDRNRVNVFEKWASRQALEAFREAGPPSDIIALVESFEVQEYQVDT